MDGGTGWVVDQTEVFGAAKTGALGNVVITGTGGYPRAFKFSQNCIHDAGIGPAGDSTHHNIYVDYAGSATTSGNIFRNLIWNATSGENIKVGNGGAAGALGPWNLRIANNTFGHAGRQILLHANVVNTTIIGNLFYYATQGFVANPQTTQIYMHDVIGAGNFVSHSYWFASTMFNYDPSKKLALGTGIVHGPDPAFRGAYTCGSAGWRQTLPAALPYGRWGTGAWATLAPAFRLVTWDHDRPPSPAVSKWRPTSHPPASRLSGPVRHRFAGCPGVRRAGFAPVRRTPRLVGSWAPACSRHGAFLVPGVARTHRTTVMHGLGGPISAEPRINDRIRVPEVRLVGPNGEQVGIVRIEDALRLAQESDLDLVEVAPMARPPVCKLMDYGKFKYESAMKAREARKNQVTHGHQGDEAPAEDRPARLRDQEGSRRAVPQGRATRSRSRSCSAAASSPAPSSGYRLLQRLADDVAGPRLRRVGAQAGRPQHDHGARAAQEEGRGQAEARGRAAPTARRRRAAEAERRPGSRLTPRRDAAGRRGAAERQAARPDSGRTTPQADRAARHRPAGRRRRGDTAPCRR